MGSLLSSALLVCLLLFSKPASASTAPDGDFGIWFGTFVEGRIKQLHPDLIFYLDSQFRFSGGGTNFSQALFRPAFGYALPYGFSVFLGYAFFGNFADSHEQIQNEHRIWQQLNWKWKFKFTPLELYSRTRFEQRWILGNADISLRLRQYLRASWFFHPLSPVGIGVGNEGFFQFNSISWSTPTGLVQNRILALLIFQIHPTTRLETGYMHQSFFTSTSFRAYHILFFRLFVSLV